MTKNNLREHLNWLIGCGSLQPSQPAYAPPTTGLASAFGATLESQTPSQSLEPVDEERYTTQKDVGGSQAIPTFARPLLPASILNAQSKDAMARLQSGSRSNNKPRMLSDTVPSSSQTPTPTLARAPGTSLKDQYSARWDSRATGKCSLSTPQRSQS